MSEPPNEDKKLAAFRAKCYRGIVKAPLDALDYDHPFVVDKRREISEQNIQRLERIFERNGCLRLQEENVINAIIRDEDLPLLLSSGISTSEQLRQVAWARDAPALSSGRLNCISGLHRVEAAKRYLEENDKWWPVRLFSADIPKPYLTRIIESFLNEQKPSDGEIFRKIRLYQRQKDVDGENRWWACLDKSKLRDLRQLLKKQDIAAAFDELIDLPGLWAKIQLGALQRLLALKCDEEMLAYLRHVKQAWSKILRSGSGILPPSIVDAATVEKLESLAPNCSEVDRDLISAMMRSGDLFPSQKNENVRQDLETNICSYPGVIPSLWTFFETLKYLEPICEILRKLLGGKVRRTIRASLRGYYFAPEQTVVQASGTTDVQLTAALSKEEAARVSYIELWIFCARHFDDLTTFTPRMEYKGTKPLVRGPNPVVWQYFAKFAMSRGFMTPRAKELSKDSCASQLALDYLRKANPLSTNFNAALIEKTVGISRSYTSIDDEDPKPDYSFITVERRCGRPYELDLARDKKGLFFRQLYIEPRSSNINLNLIRRDLFTCIFGPLSFQVSCHLPYPDSAYKYLAHRPWLYYNALPNI
ncbi:hypothetical protein EJ07DRAFT_104137 [Lizonia empirigonia]|nr:hypothetical protein EJ07DRAFT_104137 [Lizonia empirigonia]